MMTGTKLAQIDFDWLIANLEVGEVAYGVDEAAVGSLETFVLGPKAIYAAEAYVLGLFQLYPSVYFHKTTRAAEKIFTELLVRVIRLIQDGSIRRVGLSAKHPIAKFAKDPNKLENVLALDDAVVWGSLQRLARSRDPLVCDFSARLLERRLFKAIDVREEVRKMIDPNPTTLRSDVAELRIETRIDVACEGIGEKIRRKVARQSYPTILLDQEQRRPYKDMEESKGPLNQIMIRQSGGLIDLVDCSPVVRSIRTFKLFRLYIDKDDHTNRKFIKKTIGDEVGDAEKS